MLGFAILSATCVALTLVIGVTADAGNATSIKSTANSILLMQCGGETYTIVVTITINVVAIYCTHT